MEITEIDGKPYKKVLKTFGELEPGDFIPGVEGLVEVDEVFDTHVPETMLEITLENGETVTVSGNHLFYVVTELDVASHRVRVKQGKAWLKRLSKSSRKMLEEWALGEEKEEVSLVDVSGALEIDDVGDDAWVLARVASSIGPVSEVNYYYDDAELPEGSEFVGKIVIPTYDRKLFAEQLLSFDRKTKWKTKVGKVLEAKEMVLLECSYWLPDSIEEKVK